MDCTECLYFHERPGSCNGRCSNTNLRGEDLTFSNEGAKKLYYRLDFDPCLIEDCKAFSKIPRCIECNKLFKPGIGSVVYMRWTGEESQGICKTCATREDLQ